MVERVLVEARRQVVEHSAFAPQDRQHAAQQSAQYVTATVAGRQNSVADNHHARAQMVDDNAVFVEIEGIESRDRLLPWLENVAVVDGVSAL
jgi:hypothetical protein